MKNLIYGKYLGKNIKILQNHQKMILKDLKKIGYIFIRKPDLLAPPQVSLNSLVFQGKTYFGISKS